MKKIILFIISFIFLIPTVFANSINKISMDIFIDNEGNAKIKEIWDVYATGEGTEIYKTYNNVDNSKFENFSVTLNNKTFKYQDHWNTKASFGQKSYKNGINYIPDGLELCWGISKTGHNKYILEYTITNFVLELSDSQMVYWTLIPKNLSSSPDEIDIKIHSNFNYNNNLDVWGYGKYGALAYVSNGYIHMYTDEDLNSDEYMTILAKFPKTAFTTTNKDLNHDFNYYHEMAEKGSEDYEEGSMFTSDVVFDIVAIAIAIFIFFLIFIGSFIGMITKIFKTTGTRIKEKVPYFRDIPCNKDIFKAFYISKKYLLINNKTDLFGSMLLKWLKEENISIEEKESTSLFNKNKKVVTINLLKDQLDDFDENELYQMMKRASRDNILEENEFKRWCEKNYSSILSWFDDVNENTEKKLIERQEITTKKAKHFNIISYDKKEETPIIYEEAKKLLGLKNYLKDFSQINKKEAKEVHLWEYYLIYAQMFGIAKKVIKQFKEIYPDFLNNYNYNYNIDTILLINRFSYNTMSYATMARNQARSYSSGGGGFSSGGGGGGSFGGGSGGGGFR